MDVVALLAMVALPLTGVLSVQEALAGFSDPSVVLIAALFVIGDGLVRTGIAYRLGDWLMRAAGSSETRLLVLLMLAVAGLGSVMSSTGVVAIFIPVVLGIANRMKVSPRRLLMPLAFAGLISGMLTLVATPPNLVVNSELRRAGLEGFAFFDFTPIGLAILALGIGYMLLARRWLGSDKHGPAVEPRHTLADLARDYRLDERERRLRVLPGSILANQALDALRLRSEYGINVIAVERHERLRNLLLMATGNTELFVGDVLLVDLASPAIGLLGAYRELGLEPLQLSTSYYADHARELGLAEVALPPDSRLPGKTIQQLGFRSRHKLNVVGLRRTERRCRGCWWTRSSPADTLLVAGSWKHIHRLQGLSRDFLVLSLPAEVDDVAPAANQAPFALLGLALMVALMVSGLVLQRAGGADRLSGHGPVPLHRHGQRLQGDPLAEPGADRRHAAVRPRAAEDRRHRPRHPGLVGLLGDAGPHALLACLFLLTALIGLFISNTATAVLMAPVALATAEQLRLAVPVRHDRRARRPAAFMTPISSPVNTLVLGPGSTVSATSCASACPSPCW